MRRSLEKLVDGPGTAVLGWVDQTVFFLQYEGPVSADLGARSATRLAELLSDRTDVRTFVNLWSVEVVDFTARSAWVRAVLSVQRQLRSMVLLARLEAIQSTANVVVGMTDIDFRMVRSPEEFYSQIVRDDPFAWAKLDPATWVVSPSNRWLKATPQAAT